MSINRYRISELICVALLIGFIVFLLVSNSGGTDKRVKEIASDVLKVTDISQMSKKTAADAQKVFGFDTQKEEGILYYDNDNIMDVSELLIVKLNDKTDAAEFVNAIEEHVNNQKNIFKSYAPEQYAILEKSIIKQSGNVIFYCTNENSQEIYETFKKAL